MKILRSLLIACALLGLAAIPARAQQSSPGWTYGYVPSPAEWSFWFGKKSDYPGSPGCLITGCTFTGPIVTAAASVVGGLNVTPGGTPSAPNNGDIWVTSTGIFARINGVSVQLAGTPASGALTITSSSPNALAVGPNGTTNPSFNVDASTVSAATGLNVKSAAAGAGVAVSALSSATNEGATFNAKGSGTLGLGNISTGNITLGNASVNTITLASVNVVLNGASANSLTVGPNGTTNPTFNVDDSTGSAATGINVKSAAAGSGVAVSVISSGTNEAVSLNAKGSGAVSIGSSSTGGVSLASGGGVVTMPNAPVIGGNAMTFPSAVGTIAALNIQNQNVTGGATVTSVSLSSASFTVNCGLGPSQFITGPTSAWTITAPANDGSCFIFLTQPASSAQVPTFSGFTVGLNTGGTITTTASAKFTISIWRVNGTSGYSIFAHQ